MHRKKTLELLDKVGIPEPEKRLHSFPHQLSGWTTSAGYDCDGTRQ